MEGPTNPSKAFHPLLRPRTKKFMHVIWSPGCYSIITSVVTNPKVYTSHLQLTSVVQVNSGAVYPIVPANAVQFDKSYMPQNYCRPKIIYMS